MTPAAVPWGLICNSGSAGPLVRHLVIPIRNASSVDFGLSKGITSLVGGRKDYMESNN